MQDRSTRAVVTHGNHDISVVDVALSDVRPDDVLVRLQASGLCHTDVSLIRGTMRAPMPIIPGHEGAGIVEAVGSNVVGISPGDHVALAGVISCGRCHYCVAGSPNLCEWGLPTIMGARQPDGDLRATASDGTALHQWASLGTFADLAIVPERSVIPMPNDVPFDVAAVIGCGVLTGAGAALNRANMHAGASVVVIGCGGVGLGAIQGSRIAGAVNVIAVDPNPAKRDLARTVGATHTIDPTSEDVLARVRELTDGYGADFAIECAGRPELVRQAWDAVAANGTIITTGVPPAGSSVELPADELWSTEKALKASLYGSGNPRTDIPLLIELYRQGRLNIDQLITTRYTLDQIPDAVADLESGKNARGIIIH